MSRFLDGELLELLVALIGGIAGSFALRLTRWLGLSDDLSAVGVGVAGGVTAYVTSGPVQAAATGACVAGVSDLATRWFAALEKRLGLGKQTGAASPQEAGASEPNPAQRNWAGVLDEMIEMRERDGIAAENLRNGADTAEAAEAAA